MDNMTICKKIVEIEGLDLLKDGELDKSLLRADELIVVNERWEDGSLKQFMIYNPLTDDALNHRLMIKYKVQIQHENPDYSYAQCEHDVVRFNAGDNPNRAICLAIIEAHKDK